MMFRTLVLAAFASLATSAYSATAYSATVSFEGFDGLYYTAGGGPVEIESTVTGNLATGRGSPFFELVFAAPRALQTVDGFGSPLVTPRECFGNNTFDQPRAGLLPCFVTDVALETTYSLVVQGSNATLEVFAATSSDPEAILFGEAETRFATSAVISTVPLPASLALLLAGMTGLAGIGIATRRRRQPGPG